MQSCISEIHAEIAWLQVELNQLQPEQSTIIVNLKVGSKKKLQLYNQVKALDREIHVLKERELILQQEVENGIQGL